MAELQMKQPAFQSNPIYEQNEQEINAVATTRDYAKGPNLPKMDLLTGPRKDYLKVGVPLYEALIKCDCEAAKDIFAKNPELVRYSITENGETALHIAASAKVPGKVKEFVKNLVTLMKEEDLALENKSYNTALYLAAGAGNINTAKIMLEKNKTLLSIPGGSRAVNKIPELMPIYVAALFGNHNVVKYMHEKSNDLSDDHWTPLTRGWLLEKCVENNMFDITLKIVKSYPSLGTSDGNILGVLARKPESFRETKSIFFQKTISWAKDLYSKKNITDQPSENGNESVPENLVQEAETKCSIIGKTIKAGKHLYSSSIIGRTIKSVCAVIASKVVPPEKNDEALQLLKFIWNEIAKKPRKDIDFILRGPSETKQTTVNVDHAKQLFSEHIVKMQFEIQKLILGTTEHVKEDQNQKLKDIISHHIARMHYETQNVNEGPAASTSKFSNTKKTHPSRILFVAAEMGNTKFVVELIRLYPDLIWKVDDKNRSIFHIAVKHRHEGIYNLLYEIGSMKDLITPLKDDDQNNMLHLVGKSAKKKRLQDVSGMALQMQRELLWFKAQMFLSFLS